MLELISFFRKKQPEFVQLPLSEIPNNLVKIRLNNKEYVATYFHLLYEPQLIAIQFTEKMTCEEITQLDNIKLLQKNMTVQFDWEVNFSTAINLDDETIFLFEVIKVNLKVTILERLYIRRFFKRAIKKNNYVIRVFNAGIFDKILSFFYYPKPVYIISTEAEAGENSFPVDTCRQVGDYFIFGVRASNKKMQHIKIGDVIAVCLSDFSKKHLIYQLGNFSSEKGEVQYNVDKHFGISVPNISSKHCWVTIAQIHSFETQNVFTGKIISQEVTLKETPFLAHIHKFWLFPR